MHPAVKSLSTCLCLGFVTGGAMAQSTVTLYGATAVEALHITGVNTAGRIGTLNKLDNSQVTTSRLGVRGSEDLGGGLSALLGLEHQIALDTGAQNNASKFWNRGSWVGLRGPFGTVTAGRVWGVNDDIMGRHFNFGGYAIFRYTGFGHISDLNDNAVKYVSPSFDGLQARALVAAGEGTTGRTMEVAINHAGRTLEGAASYRTAKAANGLANTLTTVAGSYTLGDLRWRGGVSRAELKASGLPDARAYAIGVVWKLGSVDLIADHVVRDERGTGNDSRFTRLHADYFLSKRTSLFATVVALDNRGTARERFYGDGAAGQDQNVISLGLRHWF